MRLAILQSNPLVGAVHENLRALIEQAESKIDQADLFITPELALLGYPPRDLLSMRWLLEEERAALESLKEWTARTGRGFLVGHSEGRDGPGHRLWNAATLFWGGQSLGTVRKQRLPSYDVFDEERHFAAWPATEAQACFEVEGKKIGVFVCEDSWDSVTAFGKHDKLHYSALGADPRLSADVIVNLSASPYARRKRPARESLFREWARRTQRPWLYANCAGAQDGLIFDGASFAVDREGRILRQASLFRSDALVIDLATLNGQGVEAARPFEEWHELGDAIVTGLGDFVRKSGARSVILGLSGGIDSALCATLAAEALGPENVKGVSLPSALTSDLSRNDAADLARRLGIAFEEIPIGEAVELHSRLTQARPGSIAHQNLQSRNRGLLLMARANQEQRLLIATGNKSEFAMGYSTLYGDMCGAIAPIGDLYKTEVYALCFDRNRRAREAGRQEPIPLSTLLRPPTAELAPDQKDTDSLPPYEILDIALEGILENQGSPLYGREEKWGQLLQPRHTWASLRRQVLGQEFKRRQAPPILRLHDRSFGAGWQMPVAKGLS